MEGKAGKYLIALLGFLGVVLGTFVFSEERKDQPMPYHSIEEEIIAVYECINGRFKIVWYAEGLSKRDIEKLKQQEGVKCSRN